jgi:hypothetical protein
MSYIKMLAKSILVENKLNGNVYSINYINTNNIDLRMEYMMKLMKIYLKQFMINKL